MIRRPTCAGGRLLIAAVLWMPLAIGCATFRKEQRAERSGSRSSDLARAEALLEEGRYAEAMIACVDIGRRGDPYAPELVALQNRIMQRLAERREAAARERARMAPGRMALEIEERHGLPLTYGTQRAIRGEKGSLRGTPSAMEEVLRKKVTVHLDNVSLDDFILAIGASEDVNIVADNMDSGKTMTIRAEDVPLGELLDYIARNLGVAFYVGENIIWATPRDQGLPTTPMETRVYRLRKGLSSRETEAGARIPLIETIERFVLQPQGAQLLFNPKAHALVARNTRENLAKIEEIIEALDVAPPQILIEARFISAAFHDLRELGVDWILNSPIVVSEKKVLRNGVPVDAPYTQIDASRPDAIVGFSPFPNQAQGLNLSYQGILTDPMFQAVLHALETSGKARTLSVPKVTVINNESAVIRVGEDFRYFEEYDVQSVPSTTDAGQTVYRTTLVPVGTPTLQELGIQLQVTPSVGADLSDIVLKIVPEISSFVRWEIYEVALERGGGAQDGRTNVTGVVKLPIFSRSRIETEVVVQSGETVVMGGLITSTDQKRWEGVPILSSIPLLGRLFRHDTVQEQKNNLLIFVTAHLLSQRGEMLVPLPDITESPQSPSPTP